MHTNNKQESIQIANARLLQLDFHDFMAKSVYMQDVELSDDLGISLEDVRLLKTKWQQSRR